MARKIVTTCDGCGADISDAGGMPSKGLVLQSYDLPNSENYQLAIFIQHEIECSKYFCGLRCLDDWRNEADK